MNGKGRPEMFMRRPGRAENHGRAGGPTCPRGERGHEKQGNRRDEMFSQ